MALRNVASRTPAGKQAMSNVSDKRTVSQRFSRFVGFHHPLGVYVQPNLRLSLDEPIISVLILEIYKIKVLIKDVMNIWLIA